MKNKFIQMALVAAAATAMVSSTVLAANYWSNENGVITYFDKDGEIITDSWVKTEDNNWCYVDDEGKVITNEIIDTDNAYYYLDASGVMIRDQWVKYEDNWYYFGSNGKAYTSKDEINKAALKNINGRKYAFDSEGKMLYGWINADEAKIAEEDEVDFWKTATYYAGMSDDGAIVIGWRQVPVEDDGELKDYWFYFQDNGRKYTGEKKTIKGITYKFDTEDGHMLSEWAINSDLTASASNVSYLNNDGSMLKNGWVWALPDESYLPDNYEDNEYSWWYANNDGSIVQNTVKKINGKYYVFDAAGRMLYGLVSAVDGNYTSKIDNKELVEFTGDQIKEMEFEKLYYFSNSAEDGARKSGTVKITLDDKDYDFYFRDNGEAENGYVSKIHKFVKNGIILEADPDEGKYAGVDAIHTNVYELNTGILSYGKSISAGQILVNSAGNIMKNKNGINDGNDVYIFTDKNGVVLYAGDKVKAKKDGSIEIKGKTYELAD